MRWVGPYSLVTNKKQQFSVAAVGIETVSDACHFNGVHYFNLQDIKILGTDMESCLPAKHQYFTVVKKNSHLFMREEEVMLEEDFLGEQQREPSRKLLQSPIPVLAPQQHRADQKDKSEADLSPPRQFSGKKRKDQPKNPHQIGNLVVR